MLYKKIHRQYLRKFWIGRKFKWCNGVREITGKPYTKGCCIWVDGLYLIYIDGAPKGIIRDTNFIEWLD